MSNSNCSLLFRARNDALLPPSTEQHRKRKGPAVPPADNPKPTKKHKPEGNSDVLLASTDDKNRLPPADDDADSGNKKKRKDNEGGDQEETDPNATAGDDDQ